jgi:hypothetical protein
MSAAEVTDLISLLTELVILVPAYGTTLSQFSKCLALPTDPTHG